ncbi:MAG: hypothetical protein ACK5XN_29005 [Bacteroidota bacterium]
MNREIKMFSGLDSGVLYKGFFGIDGALPIAFTEKIMYFAKQDNVFQFFNEIFAYYALKNEKIYYKIAHEYINYFKFRTKKKNKFRLIKIHKNFNTIGKSKLSRFLIGNKSILN